MKAKNSVKSARAKSAGQIAARRIGCPGVNMFRLSQLKLAGYNPRVIATEALEGLTNSIRRFGCVEPIVVNTRGRKNIIVGGNQRFKALRKLGVTECLCITVSCSKADEKLLNLTLNNPQIQGQFAKKIGEYIEQLKQELPDKTDFLNLRIADLQNELGQCPGKIGRIPDDDIPKPSKKTKSRTGDLWILGKHRLLCGDSTKMTDLLRLMERKKAKLYFTSPPYNMAAKMYENYKDSLKSAQYISFNLIVAGNIKNILRGFLFWNISYNANSRWEFIEIFYRLIKDCNFTFLENIVWDKERAMPITSKMGLTRQYEDILFLTNQEIGHDLDFCFVGTTERTWFFDKRNQKGVSNYWRIPVRANTQMEEIHACYPVALPCKAIDLMTNPSDIVVEPFAGSGTTIIAAEKLDRRCFAMEKEPVFVDVAIERWEQWTGQKAKLERKSQDAEGML